MADFIIVAVIILLMIGAGYKVYKDRKDSPCGCGCSGCTQKSCSSKRNDKKQSRVILKEQHTNYNLYATLFCNEIQDFIGKISRYGMTGEDKFKVKYTKYIP